MKMENENINDLKVRLNELTNTIDYLRVAVELFESEIYGGNYDINQVQDINIEKLKKLSSDIYDWIESLEDIDIKDEVKRYEKTIIVDKLKGEENGI